MGKRRPWWCSTFTSEASGKLKPKMNTCDSQHCNTINYTLQAPTILPCACSRLEAWVDVGPPSLRRAQRARMSSRRKCFAAEQGSCCWARPSTLQLLRLLPSSTTPLTLFVYSEDGVASEIRDLRSADPLGHLRLLCPGIGGGQGTQDHPQGTDGSLHPRVHGLTLVGRSISTSRRVMRTSVAL